MRKVLLSSLLLTFTLALAACGSGSNLDKANGDWTCDAKATIELLPAEMKAQLAAAPGMAEAMFSAFKMNVDSKGKKLSVTMGPATETGDFTVVSDSGKSLVLNMKDDELHIDFTTDDSITVYSKKDANSKIVFARKK